MSELAPPPRDGDALRAGFERDGYAIARQLASAGECARMARAATAALRPVTGPAEFEADVGYAGAPSARSAAGGETPRRLLHAYSRDAVFRRWAAHRRSAGMVRRLLGCADLRLSQCHHNCVMTKHPGYSSATLWHQDIRYWSFDRPELVSVWLALGEETAANGALRVIPGSHRLELDRGRLDRDLFLRAEMPENARLIDAAAPIALEAGDALFFHCRLFHAAGRNNALRTKLSVVFTYHAAENRPIPGTRSAQYPSIAV